MGRRRRADVDRSRRWSPMGEAGIIGERLVELGASVLRRGRRNGGEQSQEEQRQPHPRSVAPVFLATSATILATTASISASVSVFSRGCSVTLTATDLQPSATPAPR